MSPFTVLQESEDTNEKYVHYYTCFCFHNNIKKLRALFERFWKEDAMRFKKHYRRRWEPFSCPSLSCQHHAPFLSIISCSPPVTWLSCTITLQRLLRVPSKRRGGWGQRWGMQDVWKHGKYGQSLIIPKI